MHVLQFLLRINFFTCRNFRGTQRNTALEWHLFSICVKCCFMTVMLVPQKQSVILSSRLHAIWTEGGGTFVQCQWKGGLSKSKMPTNQYFLPQAQIQDGMYVYRVAVLKKRVWGSEKVHTLDKSQQLLCCGAKKRFWVAFVCAFIQGTEIKYQILLTRPLME